MLAVTANRPQGATGSSPNRGTAASDSFGPTAEELAAGGGGLRGPGDDDHADGGSGEYAAADDAAGRALFSEYPWSQTGGKVKQENGERACSSCDPDGSQRIVPLIPCQISNRT